MADIALLIKKYLKDDLDGNEKQELESWKNESEINQQIFDELIDDHYLISAVADAYKIDSDIVARQKMHGLITEEPQLPVEAEAEPEKTMIRSLWPKLAAAAAVILILLSIAIFSKQDREPGPHVTGKQKAEPDIAPGGSKATLQLADGRTIVLDNTAMGQLARQGATQIMSKDGQLVYAPGEEDGKNEVLYNTVSTAKGQTYPLLLSDNSRIWLNAESSIRFPVSFTGNERKVEVTGEVYFEIAHNAAKPFIATVNGVNIQVLGTKFNVNAYKDEEAIKTTLIEGSVRVINGMQRKQIRPGQQAQVIANEITVTDDVNVDKITAWQQGYFRFSEDKLSEAMKNVARWYNVEVVYEGGAANVELTGDINRSSNLSSVVKLLAAMDVNARIEGRKLILKAQ
ncbi:FecR family protein [Longitalea arenae]|uniref:FecR family protein n=1 Tax=Longitalea arenae TaxID=2812558 RepID=UPI0019670718|nr:FecR family protein [Longitalea arenae]